MAQDHSKERHYQPEQTGMYQLEVPAPQLSSKDGRGPVLIHALEGFPTPGMPSGWRLPTSKKAWTPNWSRRSRSTSCSIIGPGGR